MKDKELIFALDAASLNDALEWVERPWKCVDGSKVGSQFFTRVGLSAIKLIQEAQGKVFLDLKFHDIPFTVGGSAHEAAHMGVWMFNVHALGGKRSVKNLQRNLILYYYGMAPFYSWSLERSPRTEKFISVLTDFVAKNSEMIAGLEFRKLFKEPEYALFYQMGRKMQEEGNSKKAAAAFNAAIRMAHYEARVWARMLGSMFK